MDLLPWITVGIFGGGAVAAVAGLVFSSGRLRRSGDDRMARFTYGWLATFSLLLLLACCVIICSDLVDHVGASRIAWLAVVLANVLAQPFLWLMLLTSTRKLFLGLTGHSCYGWRKLTDEDFQGCGEEMRRRLSRRCVWQGLMMLPIAGVISWVCLRPLL